MVIGYLRVSTEKQHPANQQNEIMRFATARGLEIEKWVTEVVSGKTKERDRKLGLLPKKMKKGDILIVTEISRLSRSLTDIMNIMGKCLTRESVFTQSKRATHLTTLSTAKSSALLSVLLRK